MKIDDDFMIGKSWKHCVYLLGLALRCHLAPPKLPASIYTGCSGRHIKPNLKTITEHCMRDIRPAVTLLYKYSQRSSRNICPFYKLYLLDRRSWLCCQLQSFFIISHTFRLSWLLPHSSLLMSFRQQLSTLTQSSLYTGADPKELK